MTSSLINDNQRHPCAARLQADETMTTDNSDNMGAKSQSGCCRISVTQARRNSKTTNSSILWSLVVYSLIHLTADIILQTANHHHHHNHHHQHQHQQQHHHHHRELTCTNGNIKNNARHHDGHTTATTTTSCRGIVDDGEHLNQIQLIYDQLNEGPRTTDCQNVGSSQNKHLQLSSCSSEAKISPAQTISAPKLLSTTTKSVTYFVSAVFKSFISLLSSSTHRAGIIQLASALPAGTRASALNKDQDRDVILLNSTNFNTEIIQLQHPFLHIKLIEYYLPYCSICLKFKTTYAQVARELRPWRNVIRPAAIDLGVTNNAPIAHSWSIKVVPTLRLHPPFQPKPADKFEHLLAKWVTLWANNTPTTAEANEVQKSLYEEYTKASLFISDLGVFKYTLDPSRDKRESLTEKVALLKNDLINYIEQYVQQQNSNELPATWPNLRPVTESTLAKLRRNHPREELFLIVDQSPAEPNGINLGLRLMLELSSTSAYKAIRYVRVSENRPLIEDVIAEKKQELLAASGIGTARAAAAATTTTTTTTTNSSDKSPAINEQIKLLTNSLEPPKTQDDSTPNSNNILLIHVDNSLSSNAPIRVVTGANLISVERSARFAQLQQHQAQLFQIAARSRRSLSLSANESNLKRKLDLMILYVKQTYSETKEDWAFVEALRSLDEDPTTFNAARREAIVKFQDAQAASAAANQLMAASFPSSPSPTITETTTATSTITADDQSSSNNAHLSDKSAGSASSSSLNSLIKSLNPFNSSSSSGSLFSSSTSSLHHHQDYDSNCQASNYDNRIKSLRYMLFNEIPRVSMQQADKNTIDKQEKLNTLTNLVAVIRAYFPLPDLASVQFIDGIQNYLISQQSIYSSSNLQESQNQGFDLLAFKQELKRLESEGKQLPEIRPWHSRCSLGDGHVPDIWSIFFTLTGFEYKKLKQINYQMPANSSRIAQLGEAQQLSAGATPAETASELNQPLAQQQQSQQLTDSIKSSSSGAPVERLVSPPSTSASLSLTIATPVSNQQQQTDGLGSNQVDLPVPVLLVVRDYLTHFHSTSGRAKMFLPETSDLSLDGIRQQPAEFSILWLWEAYNRVSKRLSVDSAPIDELAPGVGQQQQQQQQHPANSTLIGSNNGGGSGSATSTSGKPKNWFPAYEQCEECYRKPPSFVSDPAVELWAIFLDSIEWNRDAILNFLLAEFTWQPMDANNRRTTNIFGYQLPLDLGCLLLSLGACCLLLIVLLRLASGYIERQRRHKASLLNGNGAHYSVELQ